ncbi:MAG: hypothetical protein HGN29_17015 [Asgard group archaeon]|nr:hypothetical protein [Asgard group archaeon]
MNEQIVQDKKKNTSHFFQELFRNITITFVLDLIMLALVFSFIIENYLKSNYSDVATFLMLSLFVFIPISSIEEFFPF